MPDKIINAFYNNIKALGYPIEFPKLFIKTCKLHSQSHSYIKKLIESRKIINRYKYLKIYIAFSGGKDSVVLLHLVNQIIPNSLIFHFDHGSMLIPKPIEMEIIQNLYKIIQDRNRIFISSLGNRNDARVNYVAWYHKFFGFLSRFIKENNIDACFLGLRAEESCKRKKRVENFEMQDKSQGIKQIYPLAKWSYLDIYAYIISNNLPIPRIYHAYAKLLGYENVRLVTFFDSEFNFLGNANVDSAILPFFKHFRPDK